MLHSEKISENKDAKNLVVFGGNEMRRHEIINLLSSIDALTIYGTLSEEEGKGKIIELPKVDIVLIGGRYTVAQRNSIKQFILQLPYQVIITEPGVDYPYSNEAIFNHIEKIVNYETASKI